MYINAIYVNRKFFIVEDFARGSSFGRRNEAWLLALLDEPLVDLVWPVACFGRKVELAAVLVDTTGLLLVLFGEASVGP